MSQKPVTTAQAECLRKIANEKKVGRASFQEALDDGSFARFLDWIKPDEAIEHEYVPLSDVHIEELTALAAKVGARIHVLRRIRKFEVSAPCLSTSNKEIETDVILLNCSKGEGNWDKAIAWGNEAKLRAVNPREVYTICEQNPDLHTVLGKKEMYMVAPVSSFKDNRPLHSFWWIGSKRGPLLCWISDFERADGCFAFRE